ncbi:MAG: hypothetical protein IKV79_05715 [Oscillospiraceae bacterium]|nr:hypothetical protein [Oscillospiraceae bacterium]
MKSSFRNDVIACIVSFCIFGGIFLFALNGAFNASKSLKNWDNGKVYVEQAICTNLYFVETNRGDSWEFHFSDGSYARLNYNVQTKFDEENFRTIMHKPLQFIYSTPSKILVDIKDGDTSLLNQEYSRTIINKNKTSSAFVVFMLIPLPLFPVCLFAYVMHNHKKRYSKPIKK